MIEVVSCEEMERLEEGLSKETLLLRAGESVARIALDYLEAHPELKRVTLLAGKGNNGADAYVAGLRLLEAGVHVQAVALGQGHGLNRRYAEAFVNKGGQIGKSLDGLLLDGLLGTGFKGKVEGDMAGLIAAANASRLPIIAIDIPSGVNGTTGEAHLAIEATETVAIGLPKMGLFLRDGWNFVGKLHVADIGLRSGAQGLAWLPEQLWLPKIIRNRHKYQAGYVLGFAGSKIMSGSAKLSAFSALKAGCGIVRLFSPDDLGPAPFELICEKWSEKSWKKESARANAVFIGPGLKAPRLWLKKHLKLLKIPCVIDAAALLPGLTYPKMAVLTPHRGEALRLLRLDAMPKEHVLFQRVSHFCREKQVIVVLKGAPTVIFSPESKPIFIARGDPGMATAGAGDVLTGIIAALLAQGMAPLEGSVLGTTLHAIAGEECAKKLTSYCMTAQDLIAFLPAAVQTIGQSASFLPR